MSPKLLNFLLILTPIALYFGYIEPVYTGAPGMVFTPEKGIPALQIENVALINAVSHLAAVQSGLDKINKNYNLITEDEKLKANILLPDSIDPIRLHNEVVTIAAKSGIAINDVNVKEENKTNDPRLGGYSVDFNVKTRYGSFKNLMESFEKNMRLFLLTKASINKIKAKENQDRNSVSLLPDDPEVLEFHVTFRVNYLK